MPTELEGDVLNTHHLIQHRFRSAIEQSLEKPPIYVATDAIVVLAKGDYTITCSDETIDENRYRVQRAVEIAQHIIAAKTQRSPSQISTEDLQQCPPLILVGSLEEHERQQSFLEEIHYTGPVIRLESIIDGENTTKTNIWAVDLAFPHFRHITLVTSAPHTVRASVTASQHLENIASFSVIGAYIPGVSILPEVLRDAHKLQEYARGARRSTQRPAKHVA